MTEPLADHAMTGGHEPFRRQRHDEYSSSTDHSADYDHPIRCKLLCQRAYDRHQANDNDRVDGRKFAHRRVHPEFANAELRKYVIHLQKDGFEKSDEEEEHKQPVKTGLADQSPKKMRCIDRALLHRFPDAGPETPRSPAIAGRLLDHLATICCFGPAPEKVNRGKQDDFKGKANHEQLLVAAWFKSEKTDAEVELADVIE